MSARDLKAKYPRGRLSTAINAAVRAELIGGDAVLDACQLLKQAELKFVERQMDEYLPDLRRALAAAEAVKAMLQEVIRDRYDIGGGDAN
jgi:hypothetical protein